MCLKREDTVKVDSLSGLSTLLRYVFKERRYCEGELFEWSLNTIEVCV